MFSQYDSPRIDGYVLDLVCRAAYTVHRYMDRQYFKETYLNKCASRCFRVSFSNLHLPHNTADHDHDTLY